MHRAVYALRCPVYALRWQINALRAVFEVPLAGVTALPFSGRMAGNPFSRAWERLKARIGHFTAKKRKSKKNGILWKKTEK